MNTNHLKELFQDAYQQQALIKRQRPPRPKYKKHDILEHKKVYSIEETQDLFLNIQQYPPQHMEHSTQVSIRYLVTQHHQLLLAREGAADHQTPSHGEMASKCLAAGNLFFNKPMTKLIAINHQSGDFHPPIESLVFALKLLLHTNIPISKNFYLILNEFNSTNPLGHVQHLRMTSDLGQFIFNLDAQNPIEEAGYVTP